MKIARICVCVCLCAMLAPIFSASSAQNSSPQSEKQQRAREALAQGVKAYSVDRYADAIADFTRATQLDPSLLDAHLYLAAAYAGQYIPGATSDENLRTGRQAIAEYKAALAIDPENLDAMDGLGLILFQSAGSPFQAQAMEESRAQYRHHIQVQPGDAEPYYWLGVIDWTLAFRGAGVARTKYSQTSGVRLADTDPLPESVRMEYARENGAMIEEGIASLKKAIEIRPDYDDAMAYLNLLYRLKADTIADEAERGQLEKMADALLDQVREIKRKRASPTP